MVNIEVKLKDGENVKLCYVKDETNFDDINFAKFFNMIKVVSTVREQKLVIGIFKDNNYIIDGKSPNALYTFEFDTSTNVVKQYDCKFEPLTSHYLRRKLLKTYYLNIP